MAAESQSSHAQKRNTIFPGALGPVSEETRPSLEPSRDEQASKVQSNPVLPRKRPASDDVLPGLSAQRPSHDPFDRKRPRVQPPAEEARAIYDEFLELDQAGNAKIAVDNTENFNIVAVKRFKKSATIPASTLRPFQSDQVVSIREVFYNQDDFVIVYEKMDVTLRTLANIISTPFEHFKIAAIGKELVTGLLYIHEKLLVDHGGLSCAEILLNSDGLIKIANIGRSLIRDQPSTSAKREKDVRDLGLVMMELMEPETYMLNPHSVVLKNPKRWSDKCGIKDFLAATQNQSLRKLKDHDFLPRRPLSKCLKRDVCTAVVVARVPWNLLPLPTENEKRTVD